MNSVDLCAMPATSTAPPAPDCHVVELRQYTLQPGQRDTLIELFDREFVETQEAVGIRVLGQFRDMGDADRFVWLRGFADMAARGAALAAFYGGPVWAQHRGAANATMVDSDDVLLLRPAWDGAALPAAVRGTAAAPGVLHALVLPVRDLSAVLPACRGLPALAWYASETAPNNFPRLPVREGEPVLLAFAPAGTASGDAWASDVQARLQPWLSGPAQHLRLSPTHRSALQA